jgi:hypothetical protein
VENEPEGDLIGLSYYDKFRYGRKNPISLEIEDDCSGVIGFQLFPVELVDEEDETVQLPDISHLVSKVFE